MAIEILKESKEYLWWEVTLMRGDMTSVTCHVALFDDPEQRPAGGDWIEAVLVDPTHPQGDEDRYYVRLLAGPGGEWDHGGVEGDWQSWVRLTSTPEAIVRRPGVVTVL